MDYCGIMLRIKNLNYSEKKKPVPLHFNIILTYTRVVPSSFELRSWKEVVVAYLINYRLYLEGLKEVSFSISELWTKNRS